MNRLILKKRLAALLTAAVLISVFNPALPAVAEGLSSDSVNTEQNTDPVSEDSLNAVSDDGRADDNTDTFDNDNEGTESLSDDAAETLSENAGVPTEDEVIAEEDADLFAVSADGVSSCSLSADFAMPAAFLTKKKLTLNGMRRTVSDDTYLVLTNDGDYELSGLNGGLQVSVNKVSYNGFPAYRLSFIATSSTPKGSHKYDIIAKNKKSGVQLKKVRLIVAVTKKNPAVKWQKNRIILNNSVKGDFALNSPTVEGVSVVPLSGNKYKPKIPAGINITIQNESTIKITAGKNVKINKNYPVTLWLLYSDSTTVKAVKRKFTVKVTNKDETVKLKKVRDSSLDLSARQGTAFHYKPVIKNTGLVLNDVSFRDKSISDNYIIEKVCDPDTKEITDFYVRAKEGAKLVKGKQEFNFDMALQAPRMDAKTVKVTSAFKAAKKSSKIKLVFVNGNALKITETLSDNHIAGTIDLRVTAPRYSVIDGASIKDLNNNGAFKAYWFLDEYGQAVRLRIVIDKNKVTSGKKYNLIYSLKALGADADTAPTKITVKFKAP
ncbi:MAG: hypothetical protein K5668_07425 [Lachnospiraceae bacterium]|nr:hypothetical protein [Lachnospiraceae bacterium]